MSRVALSTVVAITGSLLCDAGLAFLGKRLFPSLAHYSHFQFGEYAKLTIIGVVIAAVGWPIVTRISSTPRWVYLRAAIATTVVLLAPDGYIWLIQNQPIRGVGVLVVMHFAIAIVTYWAIMLIAPVPRDQPNQPSS